MWVCVFANPHFAKIMAIFVRGQIPIHQKATQLFECLISQSILEEVRPHFGNLKRRSYDYVNY